MKSAIQLTRKAKRGFFAYMSIFMLSLMLAFSGMLPGTNSESRADAVAQESATGGAPELFAANQLRQQIDALEAEKEALSPEQRKIGSRLLFALRKRRGESFARSLSALRTEVELDEGGKTLVDITAAPALDPAGDEALRAQFEQMGAEIINAIGGNIRARIAPESAEQIARLPEVLLVREADKYKKLSMPRATARPLPRLTHSQDTMAALAANTSEGDIAHRVAEARDFFGYTGKGIKIGVLSDGVKSLAALQASGDLPAGLTVLPGQAGAANEDEGCALLEILHDLAPDAQLYFATVDGGVANFAKNIRDLRFTHHCDILVDDIVYVVETPFQDGQAASVVSPHNGGLAWEAVKAVTDDGGFYFSAAGNAGNKDAGTSSTWEGDYRAISATNSLHDFGTGSPFNTVTGADSLITVMWSDPLGASNNDFDVVVVNAANQIVDFSLDTQNGTQDPIEAVVARPGERIVINNFRGPQPGSKAAIRFLSVRVALGDGRLSISTPGAVCGHNAAANAFAVGAVSALSARGAGGVFNGMEAVEAFSSDGPRRIFYNADGSPITAGDLTASGGLARQKPDLCAADGVKVATPTFSPFFGTSAAAPHAAAIAALLLSAKRSLTAAQIRAALTSTVLDIHSPGADRDSGAGIVMAFPAMQTIGAVPLPRITGVGTSGKNLLVQGRNFDVGAKILVNSEQRKTLNDDQNPSTTLIGKKVAKTIDPGQTVTLQVRNADGSLSNTFSYTRAAQ